jgi:hypothetical protein
MGFYIRKSFALGKFLRLNVSGDRTGCLGRDQRGTNCRWTSRDRDQRRARVDSIPEADLRDAALKVLGRRTPS